MEVVPPPNQHERESLGSDYLPCSHSRKVSIGIMSQEHINTTRSGATTNAPAPTNTRKQSQDPGLKTSTRSLSTPMTHQVYAKTTTSLHCDGDVVHKKINCPNNSKILHLYAKQSLILQSTNGLHTEFNGVTYGTTTREDGNTQRVQEFAFAAAHQVQGEDNNCVHKRIYENTDSLKHKLWEALATVPSQGDKNSDSEAFQQDAPNLNPTENAHHKNNTALKPKQNSDTIETDSESPDVSTRRPVTRSLTRTKISAASPAKLKHKISNGAIFPSSLSHKCGNQEKNIFNFNEEEDRRGRFTRPTTTSLTTKIQKKNHTIEPRRISFSGKKKPKQNRQGSGGGEGKLKDSRTASYSTSVEKSRSNSSQNNTVNLLSESRARKEELCHSSDSKEEIREGDFSCPEKELTKKSSPHEDLQSGSSKKNSIPQCDTDSPTLGINTNVKNYVFNPSSPKNFRMEHGIPSPSPDKTRFRTKGFYSSRTPQKSKRGFSSFNAQSDFYKDTKDLKKSPIRESTPVMEEIGATHKSSQSSEDQQNESLEEHEHIYKDAGCRDMERGTAGFINAQESPVTVPTSKKRRRDELSCLAPSPKELLGTMEINDLVQLSDQNQEDGLMRAVSLLVLALDKFKTRIHSQTSKKSSEILASIGEGIQLQLQNVNSQIQKDVSKSTNRGKSKRKILETRFQEQQEKLESMQFKFKEEVAQHLQECKSTLEELETFQLELKGEAKRQKALQQKLMVQMEEAIETQLSEADRRINSMHEVARKKMYQLRHVITECLKDGVFN